jgi:acetyltransferase-like isoleucine patch superfamily enzyme
MSNPFDPGYFDEHELALMGFKSMGNNVRIAKSCTIIGLENIAIGNNVRIDGYSSIIAAGGGLVELGSFIHIAGYCGLYASHGITMDDFTGLSQGVRIYTSTDDYSGQALTNPTVPKAFTNVRHGPVTLQRHVIIGTGTALLPDVVIAEGTAVGALSLVTRSLDSWGIYGGSPAKRLKERSRNLLLLEKELLKTFNALPRTSTPAEPAAQAPNDGSLG